ncbi:MAG: hypothetical protein ACRENK_06475 [Gemmatimonadaceae bacterium]
MRPEESSRLSDARLQLHHAAQFCGAAGISFLEERADDSHTNLEWMPALGGLFSRSVPARTSFRLGLRPADLTLVIATQNDQAFAQYKLHGRTIVEATQWIRTHIAAFGLDSTRYTLKRHFDIPIHTVDDGDAFDASDKSGFEELSSWLANGASLLNSISRSIHEASEVRCWPHHFDIATIIQATPNRTIGIGLDPGDNYYDEPYFYVNMNPQPSAAQAKQRPLWGRGAWHTRRWVGAVLTGSRIGAASEQERHAREFIDSAVSACRGLITQN